MVRWSVRIGLRYDYREKTLEMENETVIVSDHEDSPQEDNDSNNNKFMFHY